MIDSPKNVRIICQNVAVSRSSLLTDTNYLKKLREKLLPSVNIRTKSLGKNSCDVYFSVGLMIYKVYILLLLLRLFVVCLFVCFLTPYTANEFDIDLTC